MSCVSSFFHDVPLRESESGLLREEPVDRGLPGTKDGEVVFRRPAAEIGSGRGAGVWRVIFGRTLTACWSGIESEDTWSGSFWDLIRSWESRISSDRQSAEEGGGWTSADKTNNHVPLPDLPWFWFVLLFRSFYCFLVTGKWPGRLHRWQVRRWPSWFRKKWYLPKQIKLVIGLTTRTL